MENNFGEYLVQLSICFSVLYLAFYCFFRRLTFHRLNRAVLLSIIPMAIMLPLIQIVPPISLPDSISHFTPLEEAFLEMPAQALVPVNIAEVPGFSISSLLVFIYCLGFGIGVLRFGLSISTLLRLKRKARVRFVEGVKVYVADVNAVFSFFGWIFIPKNKPSHCPGPILRHEQAHSRQGHTFDLLVTECLILLCWFNPFVYAYRKSVKSVHEYLADKAALDSKIKKSSYLELLLRSLEQDSTTSLISYFNHPILKNRIDMITKPKSGARSLIYYFSLLPVLGLLSVSFSEATFVEPTVSILPKAVVIQTTPPSIFPVAKADLKDISAPFGKMLKHPIKGHKRIHNGIDIKAATGTEVFATADGTASFVQFKKDWGNLIVITHSDGYETRYAHLKGFNIKENQAVKKGQVIGYVGSTGLSTGPHLHYEVLQNGKHLDPLEFFEQ